LSELKYKNSDLSTNTVVQTISDRRYFLKINKGAEKGSVFQISSNEVLIGRDPSNHIQLKNDSKVSRHHVRLLFTDQKYFIQDITKNNFIIINGIKVKQAELKNNEVIQIGDHVLQFIETEAKNKNTVFKNNLPNSAQQPNRLRLILILAILMGAGYYLTQPTIKRETNLVKVDTFDSESKSERRISTVEDNIKALDQKFKDSIYFTENGKNAQSIFIQGKRDFDRGQFFYARSAFSAVLSLEPTHAEARRMLRLSDQFADDLLEKQFKEGLASRDASRFDMCKSAMTNIMNLLNDPANPRYREAKQILIECDLKKRGNF
jgi:pSer/pThr/pTyr-binding forkhead associated (FHA) protein